MHIHMEALPTHPAYLIFSLLSVFANKAQTKRKKRTGKSFAVYYTSEDMVNYTMCIKAWNNAVVLQVSLKIGKTCCRGCARKAKLVIETENGPINRNMFLESRSGIHDELLEHLQIIQYLREIKRYCENHEISLDLSMSEIEARKTFHINEAQDQYLKHAPPNHQKNTLAIQ